MRFFRANSGSISTYRIVSEVRFASAKTAPFGATTWLRPMNSAPCSPTQVAGADLQQWATDVNGAPSYSNPSGPAGTPTPLPLSPALPFQVTTIACSQNVNLPVSCTIQIAWNENTVAANSQGNNASTASAANGFNVPTYQLYVEP